MLRAGRFPFLLVRRTVKPLQRQFSYIPDLGIEPPSFSINDTNEVGPDIPPVEYPKPTMPSFFELSACGYNGPLALAYRSNERVPRILAIVSKMRSLGHHPRSTMSYNYILSALLDSNLRREAFLLLREMEGQGFIPDVLTFELLMMNLSKDTVMAVSVDEMFQLMQVRYKLQPTSLCWAARLRSWMSRTSEHRVIQLLEELDKSDSKARFDDALFFAVTMSAAHKNQIMILDYIFSRILTSNTDGRPSIKFTGTQYYTLWQMQSARPMAAFIPYYRIIFKKMPLVDEGTYVRLLYFCARSGRGVSDLAYMSLQRIVELYPKGDTPLRYARAYLQCLETESDDTVPPYDGSCGVFVELGEKLKLRLKVENN